MSAIRDQLRAAARAVHTGLLAYIEVHDRIMKNQGTFKSVVKNLIGRGTPMDVLLAEAVSLRPTWLDINSQLSQLRSSVGPSMDDDERAYCELLSGYAVALGRTVDLLIERQQMLLARSGGGGGKAVTWDQYQAAEARYAAAVAHYMEIGGRLNRANRQLGV